MPLRHHHNEQYQKQETGKPFFWIITEYATPCFRYGTNDGSTSPLEKIITPMSTKEQSQTPNLIELIHRRGLLLLLLLLLSEFMATGCVGLRTTTTATTTTSSAFKSC